MSDEKKTTETTVVEERVEWLTKENIKKILLIALAIILMLVFFQKIGVVFVYLKKFWDIIFPFVFGASFAFVVNVPMVQIENKFLGKKPFKGKRILAWFITLVLILAVIAGAMFIVIPQIVDTAKHVAANVQNIGSLSDIQAWLIQKFPQTESLIAKVDVSYKSLVEKAMDWVQKSGSQLLNSGVGVVSNIVSGVATFFIARVLGLRAVPQGALAVRTKSALCMFPDHVNERILKVFILSTRPSRTSSAVRSSKPASSACVLHHMTISHAVPSCVRCSYHR